MYKLVKYTLEGECKAVSTYATYRDALHAAAKLNSHAAKTGILATYRVEAPTSLLA